jgi:hypothetical protein
MRPEGSSYKEGGAEGGTRTPMPLRAQRPERCVSTNFTTSAQWSILGTRVILQYLPRLVNRSEGFFHLYLLPIFEGRYKSFPASSFTCYNYCVSIRVFRCAPPSMLKRIEEVSAVESS